MITHRVIDLVYHEDENNVVMNGSEKECNDFIATQSDSFTYQVQPLLKHEIASLNEYDIALKIGEAYLKFGKKLFTILLIISCSYNVKAQISEDKNTFALISFMGGYDAKISAPVSGLSFGVRTGNVYAGVNSIIPVTSNALAPMMFLGELGLNIGSLRPSISYGYHSIGKVTEAYFRHTTEAYTSGFHFGYGCSYFLKSIPLQLTMQKTGKETILSLSIYKAL